MLLENLENYHLILATQSPRRHLLMNGSGFKFDILVPEGIEEVYPKDLPVEKIPEFLAEKKASWFINRIGEKDIVITADTIVVLKNEVIEKPRDYDDAFRMLKKLQGNTHTVITGVCFLSRGKKKLFSDTTMVTFRPISDNEIEYYLKNYKPYDKAGAYGAQEWIGYVCIERIEGSYFNIMGLPVHRLYQELEKFI